MTEGLDESHADYRCEENSVLVATQCHGLAPTRQECPARFAARKPWNTDGKSQCYKDVEDRSRILNES